MANHTSQSLPAEEGLLKWFLEVAFQQQLGGRVLAAVAEQSFSRAKAENTVIVSALREERDQKVGDAVQILVDHLKTLTEYRNVIEVLLSILRQNLMAEKPLTVVMAEKFPRAMGYPGKRFGLTAEQSALPLADVFDDGSRQTTLTRNALIRNGLKTWGELVEETRLVPDKLYRFSYIGAKIVATVVAAMRKQGLEPKESRRGKKEGDKSVPTAAGEPSETQAKPWAEFGFTENAWETPLKKIFPAKMGPRTNKARRVIGKRRVTIGELCVATQLKPARIGKYFGRGCGPSTRKFISQTVLAMAAPIVEISGDVATVTP